MRVNPTAPLPLPGEALHRIAFRLREHLDLSLACILLPDATGALGGPCTDSPGAVLPEEALRPVLHRVLESGAPLLEADAASHSLPGRALAIHPLLVAGHEAAGCLVAVGRTARDWSPAERAALESTAAGAAAEVARLREADVRAASERRASLLQQALELVPLGVTITDPDGRIVFTNPAEARMHGYGVEELYGRSARSLAPPELWDPARGARGRVRRWMRERTNLRRDGSEFPVRLWSDPVLDGEREVGLVTACADLSEWGAAEAELREREGAFRAIVELAPELIVRFDEEGRLAYLNPAAEQALGLQAERCAGRTLAELAAEGYQLPWGEALQQVGKGKGRQAGEGELRTPDRVGWLRFRAVPERPDGGSVLVFATDLTEHRLRERRLIHDAERDPLTGVFNRDAFLRRLELACAADAEEAGFAVLFLDLDRFKPINDTLGHAAGDAVLVAVSERLRSGVRPTDVVGRLGGDEFAVLLQGATGETDAVSVVARMQRLLEVPILVGGQELRVSASTGIALGTAGETPEAVLRSADRAMYRAKAMGPGHYGILDSELRVHEEAVLDARRDLRQAIERGQLRLLYQPIVSLDDGRVVALEALVRWQHPQRGLLGPQAFLPIAEQTGLIVELDRWVVREALAQLRTWRGQGLAMERSPVSINFSGRHLVRRDAAEHLEGLLAQAGVDPACVMLEVTETSVMDDRDSAAAALARLRRSGIRICLDDFGTGYSSLAYLRQFPFDVLKIDRSFIQRIDTSQADRAIVRSILALARTLELEVTAEGVETPRQRSVLRSLGCHQAQGFLVSEPLPPERAVGWIPR